MISENFKYSAQVLWVFFLMAVVWRKGMWSSMKISKLWHNINFWVDNPFKHKLQLPEQATKAYERAPTVEWLNGMAIIIWENISFNIISNSTLVVRPHDGRRSRGMRETQGMTKLMHSHREQISAAVVWKHWENKKRRFLFMCNDMLYCKWVIRQLRSLLTT